MIFPNPAAIWRDRHLLQRWRKVTGHGKRHIVYRGHRLQLVEYEIEALNAPAGFSLLFLSDLHWQSDSKLAAEAIKLCAKIKPDWIVYGGDLISYSTHLQSAADLLHRLEARLGKFCVPGNWDRKRWKWFSEDKWRMLMADSGFSYLNNQGHDAPGGVRFWGTDDLRLGRPGFEPAVPRPQYQIVVTHNPDTVIRLEYQLDQIDLILSGHTHGGQIRLPGIGPLYTSSEYWRKFDYGRFRNSASGTEMIVTSGAGSSSIDIRVGCPKEMAIIRFY